MTDINKTLSEREEYRKYAKDLSKNSLELIEFILIKHNTTVIETMHDEIKKKIDRIDEIKSLVTNDKNASMFQSLGQYRKWLLGEIKKIEESLK